MRDSVQGICTRPTYGFMQHLTTEPFLPRHLPSLSHMEPCPGPSAQDLTAPAHSGITQAALANLSQALDASLQHVELTFVYEMSYLRQSTINLVLLTVFFGMSSHFVSRKRASAHATATGLCTVLAIVAVYVLLCV